jgi:hypothetical protein
MDHLVTDKLGLEHRDSGFLERVGSTTIEVRTT